MDKILFVIVLLLFVFIYFQCLATKRKRTLHQSFFEASYSFFFSIFLLFCFLLCLEDF